MKKITALFLLALASLAQSPPFVPSSSSGGASGPAGGDLAGTYPNPTIPLQIQDTGLLGPFTAAQVQGMFGTPITLIAAPGSGKIIRPISLIVDFIFGSAQFTLGGAWGLYYGSTAPQVAGTEAAPPITAANLNAQIANALFMSTGRNGITTPSSVAINAPITLSNETQAFAGGTGSTIYVEVKYYIQSGLQ